MLLVRLLLQRWLLEGHCRGGFGILTKSREEKEREDRGGG